MLRPTQKEQDEVDEAVKSLIKSHLRPEISKIAPLAKKLRISDVGAFWDFFDAIERAWADERSVDSRTYD